MTSPPKIAVLRLGAMGDVLFTTPALRALKQQHPGCHITYITMRKWRFVLRGNPTVDRVVGLSYRDPKALRGLRNERFDLAINLHGYEDGARICQALNAGERRGAQWSDGHLQTDPDSALLLDDRNSLLSLYRSGLHYPEVYCRVAGVKADSYRYDFTPGPWAEWRARLFCARYGLTTDRAPVAMHLHSRGSVAKSWSAERVREVVRRMPERRFVILGYSADREWTRPLEHEPNAVVCYADICVQAAILRRCRAFVGIDSGPRQIASALGLPCITLFGPRPKSLLPEFPGDVALTAPCPNNGCFATECPEKIPCLDQIPAEDIIAAINEVKH